MRKSSHSQHSLFCLVLRLASACFFSAPPSSTACYCLTFFAHLFCLLICFFLRLSCPLRSLHAPSSTPSSFNLLPVSFYILPASSPPPFSLPPPCILSSPPSSLFCFPPCFTQSLALSFRTRTRNRNVAKINRPQLANSIDYYYVHHASSSVASCSQFVSVFLNICRNFFAFPCLFFSPCNYQPPHSLCTTSFPASFIPPYSRIIPPSLSCLPLLFLPAFIPSPSSPPSPPPPSLFITPFSYPSHFSLTSFLLAPPLSLAVASLCTTSFFLYLFLIDFLGFFSHCFPFHASSFWSYLLLASYHLCIPVLRHMFLLSSPSMLLRPSTLESLTETWQNLQATASLIDCFHVYD